MCSATLPRVPTAPEIPGYRVAGICGRGGFGIVYRAWQQAVGREVAVKVDNRVLLTERDQRRFLREVTAAGRLSGHPNVIDVYDAGALPDGRPYLVLELCPGGSLQDELRRDGRLTSARVRDIGVALADALAAAHQAGVLHRDIKARQCTGQPVRSGGLVGLRAGVAAGWPAWPVGYPGGLDPCLRAARGIPRRGAITSRGCVLARRNPCMRCWRAHHRTSRPARTR